MTPERFQQIAELFHAAREEGSAERREAILAQTDPELRREVELLLAGEDSSGGAFLDRPALQNAPELLEHSGMAALNPGDCLGPYRVETKLDEGGMGEVYKAIDTRLGRTVAVKIVPERFNARFEREARAISSLNHPNICTLYDVGPNYLVMELVEGETIAARLRQSGAIPVTAALGYAVQIAAALVEAHAKGIVHRDLKPGNIMITKSETVKVLDFGLAKTTQDKEAITEQSRFVIGTPAYMSPEQIEGKSGDVRSDIFSFGCVLYEMLTGIRAALSPHRRRISPRALEDLITRCLEVDPDRRWQSVTELKKALERISPGSSLRPAMVPAVGIAAAAVALLAAGYFYFFPRDPALTSKDIVVLADFVNNGGDPVFDGTLRQGLAFLLEQSPFLKIMDTEQVQRVFRLMSLPANARITDPVAREICIREGAAATIGGVITSLGQSYVITLEATACQDGASLAREQTQAQDKEHVLSALGSAATALRAKLGESHKSIQTLNRPLEQATTSSLEALKSYTDGYSELTSGQSLAAVPRLERAVALDPNFAMAYHYLSVAYDVAGDAAKSRDYSTRAFELMERTSAYERDLIAALYYGQVTGELDKAIATLQSSSLTYPRRWGPHNNLSMNYIELGRYEEGLKEGLEASRLQPDAEPSYRRQLDAYICLDRLQEAKQLAEKLRKQGIDRSRIHQRFLEIAYIENDPAAVDRELQWFAGKPEEYLGIGLQAANLNLHGRLRESHELYQRAAEIASRRGLHNVASDYMEADARAAALAGNCQPALHLGRPAVTLALCGDAAGAEKRIAEMTKLFPNGTIWNAVQLPGIRAAIALERDQPAKSLELLASAAPYEPSSFETTYLRGLAYLKENEGAKAVAEFRKILDHKGANWASDWRHPNQGQFYALSHLGMARGLALAGDPAKAKEAYQQFFGLWKDADPGLPVLKQAKAEYAKLLVQKQ